MKSLILPLIIATATMVGCTHATVDNSTEPRTPASANTGQVGSVNENDRDGSANWYRKQMAKSHMQIATRMAQARQKGLVCDTDAYHLELITEFKKAVQLDENIEIDHDVKLQLANMLTYRVYLAEKKEGFIPWGQRIKKMDFDGLVWRAMGHGVYGTSTIYTQKANGVLEASYLDIDTMKWNTITGTWKLAVYPDKKRSNGSYRPSVEVLFFTVKGKTRAYDINQKWDSGFHLSPHGSKADSSSDDLTDYINDECEA